VPLVDKLSVAAISNMRVTIRYDMVMPLVVIPLGWFDRAALLIGADEGVGGSSPPFMAT
jgi:hypothetical protein